MKNSFKLPLATLERLNQVRNKTKKLTTKEMTGFTNLKMSKLRTQKKTGPALVKKLPQIPRMTTLLDSILQHLRRSLRI